MIEIKDQDFEMKQVKDTSMFSLKILTTINAGKATERQELKTQRNDVSFETAIKTIVMIRLSKLNKTFSLSEYLSAFKEEVNKIEKLITDGDK